MAQATLLALRDPQIDDTLARYGKKDKKDADALHYNIELALSNMLVRRAIEAVNRENGSAKSYARLLVEWKTDDFLKEAGIAAANAITAFSLGCGGETLMAGPVPAPVPAMDMRPMPTREHALAERRGLMGVLLGEPLPFSLRAPSTLAAQNAMVFGGDELPLLRDQFIEGSHGDVLVTQKLYVQTRVMFDVDDKKLEFRGMGVQSTVEFSDPLALKPGSEFDILGRHVKVVRVSSSDLVLEDSKGKRYTLSNLITNDFLGMDGIRASFGSRDGGKSPPAIVLNDIKNSAQPGQPQRVTGDSLLIMNTFGLNLKGLDLKDEEYGYIRIGPPPLELQNVQLGDVIGLPPNTSVKVSAEISTTNGTFIIDGTRLSTFYQVGGGTPSTFAMIIYKDNAGFWHLAQTSIKYDNGDGQPYSLDFHPLETTSLLFQENSGRPGADYVRLSIQGYTSNIYSPTSRTPEEGGTKDNPNPSYGYKIPSPFITFRGSYIQTSRTVGSGVDNVIEYSPATRVGNVVVQVTQ